MPERCDANRCNARASAAQEARIAAALKTATPDALPLNVSPPPAF